MRQEETIQREILEQRIDRELEALSEKLFGKKLEDASDEQVYVALLYLVKGLEEATVPNDGDKKIYYISAEFLIGKLLSNNLINLGIYEKVESVLKSKGKELSRIEEIEPEPSLGNGGLGRLAACFMDSIATLGLPGEGIGLNYHFGLFKQVFKDRLQTTEKNDWIEKDSWLNKTDVSFDVFFGDRKVTSRLYDIDVVGYNNGVNKLRLFDIESVDESIVKEGITFDKEAIEKNLTLFLYPDDSDEAGNLLRIYQQYFMVSNAAQLILMEMKEKQYDLRKMYDYAVIQINDTHPSMVIPELIRILVNDKAFTMDEAIEAGRSSGKMASGISGKGGSSACSDHQGAVCPCCCKIQRSEGTDHRRSEPRAHGTHGYPLRLLRKRRCCDPYRDLKGYRAACIL